jgi:hypothetical protein
MKSILLLNYNEDTKQVEEKAKKDFLHTILERCFENTPMIDRIHAIYDTDEPLTVPKKMELRGILTKYNIAVIDDDVDGALRIFLDTEEIGVFKKPIYRIKTDSQEKDPRKRVYLEMEINFCSSFEKEEEAS